MKNKNILITIGLIGLSVLVRIGQFIPNVSPVGAVAIFSGFYFRSRWAYLVPVLAMLLADLVIGFYNFWVMAAVYGSFGAAVVIGRYVKKSANVFSVAAGVLAGSVIFYAVTNFAVWAISSWYPPTLGGLMLSYTMALPFFRNTLLGDLLFGGLLFGAYETGKILARRRRAAKALAKAKLVSARVFL